MDNFRRYFSETEGTGLTLSAYRLVKTAAAQVFRISIRYNDANIQDTNNIELDYIRYDLNGNASLDGSGIYVSLTRNESSNVYTATLNVTYNGETASVTIIQSADAISETQTYRYALNITDYSYNVYNKNYTESFGFTIYPTISGEKGTCVVNTYYSGRKEEIYTKTGEFSNVETIPFDVNINKDGSRYQLSYVVDRSANGYSLYVDGKTIKPAFGTRANGNAYVRIPQGTQTCVGDVYSSTDSIDMIFTVSSGDWYVAGNNRKVYNVSFSCQTPSTSGIAIGQDVFIS